MPFIVIVMARHIVGDNQNEVLGLLPIMIRSNIMYVTFLKGG